MHLFIIAITILMGIAVGWSIGANDAANSLGVAVGSRVLTFRQAILLICIFGFLGAYFNGAHVIKTVGKGIVPLDQLDKNIALYVALVASFGACAWVALATHWKMPISTSHSIVGAVAGAGLAVHAPISWKVLFDVFMCWILTPVGAAIMGFVICIIVKNTFYRIVPRRFARPILVFLVITSGCYVAFTWGANDVANCVGVISGAGILSINSSIILGIMAILFGIITLGYKVIQTVGSEITNLVPVMAFSAQLASALNVHIYTLFGIPVSTSHSIVGAIFGVGMVRGLRVLNIKILKNIIISWIATPFVSGVVSFSVLKGIMLFE